MLLPGFLFMLVMESSVTQISFAAFSELKHNCNYSVYWVHVKKKKTQNNTQHK